MNSFYICIKFKNLFQFPYDRPSTSKDEEFSKRLYEAENHGNDENCDSIYGEKCPISVLDLITSVKSLIKI